MGHFCAVLPLQHAHKDDLKDAVTPASSSMALLQHAHKDDLKELDNGVEIHTILLQHAHKDDLKAALPQTIT